MEGILEENLKRISSWIFDPKQYNEAYIKLDTNTINDTLLLQYIINSIQDGICLLDKNLNIINVNEAMRQWYTNQKVFYGRKCYSVYHNLKAPCSNCPVIKTIEQKVIMSSVVKYTKEKKDEGWQQLYAIPILNANNEILGVIEYIKDISVLTNIKKHLEEIEYNIEELKDKNRILNNLIEKQAYEKKIVQDGIDFKMEKIIKPAIKYILKYNSKNDNSDEFINMFLNELSNSVKSENTTEYSNFSPREIQIADLIKEGSSSKEIASKLFVSQKTVDFHRKNIRKKLGLKYVKGSSCNLKSYLITHNK